MQQEIPVAFRDLVQAFIELTVEFRNQGCTPFLRVAQYHDLRVIQTFQETGDKLPMLET
jgi:hypothetical protein